MNTPRSLNAVDTRKLIRTVQIAMLGSIVLYALVISRVSLHSKPPGSAMLIGFALISVLSTIVLFMCRRVFVGRSERTLANNPRDTSALSSWLTGHIISYAIAESIALYGVMFRFLGFATEQIAPFLVAGFLLILFLGPSALKPASSDSPIQRM